jgi:hypothetical protein
VFCFWFWVVFCGGVVWVEFVFHILNYLTHADTYLLSAFATNTAHTFWVHLQQTPHIPFKCFCNRRHRDNSTTLQAPKPTAPLYG